MHIKHSVDPDKVIDHRGQITKSALHLPKLMDTRNRNGHATAAQDMINHIHVPTTNPADPEPPDAGTAPMRLLPDP